MPRETGIQDARNLWRNGDLAGAERGTRALLANDRSNADAWRLLAGIALAQGRRKPALHILENGYAACGAARLADDIAAWHVRARDPAAARPWLERAQGRNAKMPAARIHLVAQCDWLAGDYPAAVARFEAACAAEPDNPRHADHLARALASLGRAADAAACLRRQLPGGLSAASHGLLVLCEFDLNGPQAALAAVERGRLEYAADPALGSLLAALLSLLDRADEIPSDALGLCESDPRARAQWESFRHAHSRLSKPVFHGLTTAVLDHGIAASPPAGLVLEFGVYRGLSLRFIAERVAGPVHGFDSFEGLPEAWKPGEEAGSYSAGGTLPAVPSNVTLHPGWFEQTATAFFSECGAPVRLLHIDCDIYSSTATVLAQAAPFFVPGTIVVFDEYAGYPGYEEHEFRAWLECVERNGIRYEYLAFNLTAKKAALRITG